MREYHPQLGYDAVSSVLTHLVLEHLFMNTEVRVGVEVVILAAVYTERGETRGTQMDGH